MKCLPKLAAELFSVQYQPSVVGEPDYYNYSVKFVSPHLSKLDLSFRENIFP